MQRRPRSQSPRRWIPGDDGSRVTTDNLGAAAAGLKPLRHTAPHLVLGLVVFVLLGWGLGELWTSIAGSTDLDAIRDVADGRTATMIDVSRGVTWAGSAVVLVPLATICCLGFARAGFRREAVAVALSLGGAILIWHIVKPLVARARPPVEHLQHVSGASFPSGHAMQAGAFWLVLVLALRTAGASRAATGVAAAVTVAIVAAVCASRVVLGVHYPGDVAAGALLGAGWALFVSECVRNAAVQ
jgi:membrane-associated phospholipid phosphatase